MEGEGGSMYSGKIKTFLDKNGIRLGDRIEAIKGATVIRGELMPKPDAGDAETVIVKLDNGYNIGIRFSSYSLRKIGDGKGDMSFPSIKLGEKKGLPNVSLIYTGGTIGSKIDYKTGGVYMLIKPEELLYEIPEISDIANISVRNLMSIASEDMSHIEWQAMAREAGKAVEEGARGVVITHGTDTMHYTAAALSFMLEGIGIPVVITGAQRSSDRGSSDAFMNLICSTALAAKSDIKGVGICMHSSSSDDRCSFVNGTRARKMHTSRRDAFRPINDTPIAYVSGKGDIEYNQKRANAAEGPKEFRIRSGFDDKVAIVKTYPNSDPGILDYYADRGYHGIIIEGTGLGHAPVSTGHEELSWMPNIIKAVERGIVVGMTSQCIYGRVHPNVYRNLRLLSKAGVIYCEDMTTETAYVKLGWLLGNYTKEETIAMLNRNMRGEIKERTNYDEFLI